jgi:hypothetical protein
MFSKKRIKKLSYNNIKYNIKYNTTYYYLNKEK